MVTLSGHSSDQSLARHLLVHIMFAKKLVTGKGFTEAKGVLVAHGHLFLISY